MWRQGSPPDDRHYWITMPGWESEPLPVSGSQVLGDKIIKHWFPPIIPPPAPPDGHWSKKRPAGSGWYWIFNNNTMWLIDVELENYLGTNRKGSLWWPYRVEPPKVWNE